MADSMSATTTITEEPRGDANASIVVEAVTSTNHASVTVEEDRPNEGVVAVEAIAAAQASNKRRIAMAVFVLLGNMVQMISNGATVAGGFKLGQDLGIDDLRKSNWIAASYPLTQGTFVLISGRLGAVYGHKNMLLLGVGWFASCSLINNFCNDFLIFNIMRGLTGVGGALILPNAIAMIGITFPPGKIRNFCLGIFGAAAPIGGWAGALLAGVFTQFTPWRYLFVVMGGLALVVFAVLWWLLPDEVPMDRRGKIDWIGATLGTSGLILFNVAWNQAPAVGWQNPSEYAVLLSSVAVLSAFAYWEYRFATSPIMPIDIWKAPSFLPLMLAVVMSFMSVGIVLWYMNAWLQLTRGWSVLHFAIGWTPFLFVAVFAAWLASFLIPRMSAQWIIAIGLLAIAASNALIASMPVYQSYWPQVFPAVVLMAFCPDLVFTAASIIASNAVRRSQQGVAASFVGVLLLYGNSIGLGFAGTIEMQIDQERHATVEGYRAALWFGTGIALLALVLDLAFVRMKKDEREGWDEADLALDEQGEAAVLATGTELHNLARA